MGDAACGPLQEMGGLEGHLEVERGYVNAGCVPGSERVAVLPTTRILGGTE